MISFFTRYPKVVRSLLPTITRFQQQQQQQRSRWSYGRWSGIVPQLSNHHHRHHDDDDDDEVNIRHASHHSHSIYHDHHVFRWNSTTTPVTNNNNTNKDRQQQQQQQQRRWNSTRSRKGNHHHGDVEYESVGGYRKKSDGSFRSEMTTPLRIKLNNYYNTSSISSSSSSTISLPTMEEITKYTTMITNLLCHYHTKNVHRREDVRDTLRTDTDYRLILSSFELLLVHSNNNNKQNQNSHENDKDEDALDTSVNKTSHQTNNVFYTIFQNIDIEALLKLRIELEEWIHQFELTRLDTYLVRNDLNDDIPSQQSYQQKEIELQHMKRWTKLFMAVLLYNIRRYVVARRILPRDVTMDLLKVSTVHDELPVHYNDHFNPYTGATNRAYAVYWNKKSMKNDPIIPSRIIKEEEEQQQQQQHLNEPIVILCVSLQPKIPRSLREIFCPPVVAESTTSGVQSSSTIIIPRNNVATFYSILNVQHQQYSQLKLGEYLIHEAVKLLHNESSSLTNETENDSSSNNDDIIRVRNKTTTDTEATTPIDTFVTLSPIPGFSTWFLNEIDICTMYCDPEYSYDETSGDGIVRKNASFYHTIQFLARQWCCEEEDLVVKITDYLYARSDRERIKDKSKGQRKQEKQQQQQQHEKITSIPIDGVETPISRTPNSSPQIQAAMRYLLEGMAAHYIVHVKIGDTNGSTTMSTSTAIHKPTNGVARFHLQNGAEVYRINAFADLSISGITDSLSVMVNYRYNLSQLEYNQRQYDNNYTVMMHEYVKQQLQ